MKKYIYSFCMAIAMLVSLSSCERIDAGHEGILVNLYGSDRGVDDVNLVTGVVWYNPFTQSVYEYPTFVQTMDYEPFTINAKDGSEFTIDPNVNIYIVDGKTPQIFKKFRKPLIEVLNGPIFKHVKDACRIEINRFTTDQIISKREEVENAIEKRFKNLIEKEGFKLDGFTTGLTYPKTIVEAVNAKNKAVQEAQKAENEVKVAEAQARKLVVQAEAEAEANRLRTQALTPAVLQKEWIDKWDGSIPSVITGGGTQMFMDISKFK